MSLNSYHSVYTVYFTVHCLKITIALYNVSNDLIQRPRMGSKTEEKAKKHGLYVKTAPQETDGVDDRKPFPSDSTSTTTRDDPRDGKSSQSQTTIKVLLLFNMMSAFLNGINDCDETFNYWEPLHYLLFGEGFQTWEYSPEYGLRSWFYIFIHSIPSIPVSSDRNKKFL